jgi:hypothetical protein
VKELEAASEALRDPRSPVLELSAVLYGCSRISRKSRLGDALPTVSMSGMVSADLAQPSPWRIALDRKLPA